MKEGMSMEVHLKHVKEITDRLAAIGSPISEEDQVVTLLGSLPPSYSTLVTALEARVDDIKLNFVQQALIHEEQKQHGQFGHSNDPASGGQSISGRAEEVVKQDTVAEIAPGRNTWTVQNQNTKLRLLKRIAQIQTVMACSQQRLIRWAHPRWANGW